MKAKNIQSNQKDSKIFSNCLTYDVNSHQGSKNNSTGFENEFVDVWIGAGDRKNHASW